MTTTKSVTLAIAAAALASLSSQGQLPTQPYLAYDNTASSQKINGAILHTSENNKEIGDEINLLNGANTVIRFQFEYVYTGPTGPAVGILRFHELIPVGAGFTVSPNPPLLESSPFVLENGFHQGDTRNTAGTDTIAVAVPGRFVWSVEFINVPANATAGLLFYNGAGVGDGPGESANDHWERDPAGWNLYDNALGIDNFGARVTVVPEPGTVALMVAGGIALVAAARRRKA
jgi:hypothetical protein